MVKYCTGVTVLFYLLLFCSFNAGAQFNETIRSGRPGQAIGPYSVGAGVFQTQTGFDLTGFHNSRTDVTNHGITPNTVLRFGITKSFDINTAISYTNDAYHLHDSSYSTNGLSTASIGTRINLYSSENYVPSVGMQVTFKLPILSPAYNSKYFAPSITFIISEKLTDKFNFLSNFGFDWNGDDAKPGSFYAANISYSIAPKWGTFIENYGSFSNGNFENNWDTGIAWLVNNNLQFDAYGGAGSNYGKVDYLASIGISWRLVAASVKR